jgi:hypothetical protein
MNYSLLVIYSFLTLVISILILLATFAANRIKAKVNFSLFILSIFALALLASFQVNTYPFSNIAIICFGVFGGSALASLLSKKAKTVAFLIIMLLLSALDITSFATGPQTSGSIPDTVSIYINFVINIAKGDIYKVGSLDILILSLGQAYLAFKGLSFKSVLIYSVVALQLPFLFVLLFNPSGGSPLIPFISFFFALALIMHDKPRMFKKSF